MLYCLNWGRCSLDSFQPYRGKAREVEGRRAGKPLMIPRLGRAIHPRPALKQGPKAKGPDALGGGLATRMYPTQSGERSLREGKTRRSHAPHGPKPHVMSGRFGGRARITQVSLARGREPQLTPGNRWNLRDGTYDLFGECRGGAIEALRVTVPT